MSHPEFLGCQTADAVEFTIAPVVRGVFEWYKVSQPRMRLNFVLN